MIKVFVLKDGTESAHEFDEMDMADAIYAMMGAKNGRLFLGSKVVDKQRSLFEQNIRDGSQLRWVGESNNSQEDFPRSYLQSIGSPVAQSSQASRRIIVPSSTQDTPSYPARDTPIVLRWASKTLHDMASDDKKWASFVNTDAYFATLDNASIPRSVTPEEFRNAILNAKDTNEPVNDAETYKHASMVICSFDDELFSAFIKKEYPTFSQKDIGYLQQQAQAQAIANDLFQQLARLFTEDVLFNQIQFEKVIQQPQTLQFFTSHFSPEVSALIQQPRRMALVMRLFFRERTTFANRIILPTEMFIAARDSELFKLYRLQPYLNKDLEAAAAQNPMILTIIKDDEAFRSVMLRYQPHHEMLIKLIPKEVISSKQSFLGFLNNPDNQETLESILQDRFLFEICAKRPEQLRVLLQTYLSEPHRHHTNFSELLSADFAHARPMTPEELVRVYSVQIDSLRNMGLPYTDQELAGLLHSNGGDINAVLDLIYNAQ